MKIYLVLLLMALGCSSDPNKQDWDSGAARGNAFQEEGTSERNTNVRDQLPDAAPPATEQSVP